MKQEQLVRALGWFSIGLGLAELLAPKRVGKSIGLHNNSSTLRLLGAREIASGIGILSKEKPTEWMWSRVAGDALDLALIGSALMSGKNQKGRLAIAAAAVAGVTVADVICSTELTDTEQSPRIGQKRAAEVKKSLTIKRSPAELYEFWRNFRNLPRIMKHLESVEMLPNNRSHWVAKAPAGRTVEWEAEIVADIPNELIAWRSVEESQVETEGSVQFKPALSGNEIVVSVDVKFRPIGGILAAKLSKAFAESPQHQIPDDLRRFKQLMETGEIPTVEGQPSGRFQSETKYEGTVKELATT